MKRINMNLDWQFKPGWADGAWSPACLTGAYAVSLPHDFTIAGDPSPESVEGAHTGYMNGGAGAYHKQFFAPEDWRGQNVELYIDGAYRLAEVWLNGHKAGMHPNGYTPYYVDLTPYVEFGRDNRLVVCVNNSAPCSSRWYTGSGLYRSVELCLSPKLRLAHWPIYAYTQAIEGETARVMAEVSVENGADEAAEAHIGVQLVEDDTGRVAAWDCARVTVPAQGKATAYVPLKVDSARLWSADKPNLYQVQVILNENDTDQAQFGIRVITVDAERGLRINGESVKLKGGCVHHTLGILGAAAYRDAEFKRVKLHKDNGYNALRCAHNPPSRDFLDACDRLGVMVIDEAFDMWKMPKRPNDYHLFFDHWWREDMRLFMTRDRTHPCVIMWSTGNEVGERNGASDGARLSRELADFARELDGTRPITNAVPTTFNGLKDADMKQMHADWANMSNTQNASAPFAEREWARLTREFCEPLDVVGYNYLERRYIIDHDEFPNRVICGTESFPMRIGAIWPMVERLPYLIGDFTWTSADYLGEAGLGRALYTDGDEDLSQVKCDFPWRAANDADFDLCDVRRPQSHFKSIVWGSNETYIAVLPPKLYGKREWVSRWGWPEVYAEWCYPGYEGARTRVDVYSAAEQVTLYVNGERIDSGKAGRDNNYAASFDVAYTPGSIVAVSEENGREISRVELKTPGEPAALKLMCEQPSLRADGQSLAYVDIEIVDIDGRRVPFCDLPGRAEVTGGAALLAFGTGRPQTEENYTSGNFTSYLGRWRAILRAGTQPGVARLRVCATGLRDEEIEIVMN